MIKKNKSYFQKMLAGKRCAVVASSGFLKNRRLGSYIDNFDFIARCNIWTFDNSQSLDLGSRCDFWYGRPLVQHLKLKLETFNENYIKLLCLLPRTKEGWEHWDEDHSKFLNEYNHLKFNYRVIDVDEYLQFEEKLSSVPYTGILAIHDLLLNGAAEVHAIGFDFYKSGYSHSVPVGRTNTFNGRHDLIACQKYLWELIKNEPRFKCDYHLQSILEKIFKPTFKRNASKLVKILLHVV